MSSKNKKMDFFAHVAMQMLREHKFTLADKKGLKVSFFSFSYVDLNFIIITSIANLHKTQQHQGPPTSKPLQGGPRRFG